MPQHSPFTHNCIMCSCRNKIALINGQWAVDCQVPLAHFPMLITKISPSKIQDVGPCVSNFVRMIDIISSSLTMEYGALLF